MPPDDFSTMGGGSNLSGMMQADTPLLRQKYYEMLDSGINSSQQPAQIDGSAALWQGLLPALGVALATGGKSFGASAAPLSGVMAREQKRADENQSFSINAKLKSAGLLGEELTKREGLAARREEKEEQRVIDRAKFDETMEQRKEELRIRDENADQQRTMYNENADLMRGVVANNAAMADARGRASGERANSKAEDAIFNTVTSQYETRSAKIRDAATQVQQAQALVQTINDNPNNATAAVGALKGAMIQISQGGGRVSDKDIALVAGESVGGRFTAWKNWFDGGGQRALPESSPKSIALALGALQKAVYQQYSSLEKATKGKIGAMNFGDKEAMTSYVDARNPFDSPTEQQAPPGEPPVKPFSGTIDPNKTYVLGDGRKISGAEYLKMKGQ